MAFNDAVNPVPFREALLRGLETARRSAERDTSKSAPPQDTVPAPRMR